MSLAKSLEKKKPAIINRWFNLVVETYPPDTRRFIKNQKDPFSNPVGQTTRQGLIELLTDTIEKSDRKTIVAHLDPIIRIRAVQDFSPSKAVAFIPDLKKIVRELVENELYAKEMFDQWFEFEHRVDALTLVAFDVFVSCREKIYELKTQFEKKHVYKAFSRAGLINEEPDNGQDFGSPQGCGNK
jgi:hypothetical protein